MGPPGRSRATLSCARCYLMKKKCDKKVPSCSRCIQAKTSCLAINRSNETEVPRSIVRHLEARLAEAENSIHGREPAGTSNFPYGVSEVDIKDVREYVIRVASLAITSVCSPALVRHNRGVYYEAKLFYGSERPPLKIPVKGVYNEEPPRMASQGSGTRISGKGAVKIPREVAKVLFDNYILNILPRYPCFDEHDLVEQFNYLFSKMSEPDQAVPDNTWFIVSMVLSISSVTSKAQDFRKVASLSESLHRDAVRHSSFLETTSARSLQCILLLVQMALLLPYTSNLWYMTGEAVRMAITLGFHQEGEWESLLTPSQVSLRRRIFWTAYHLERTVAIAFGCPLAISDEHITTKIPIDSTETRSSLGQFLRNVQLCQLQSEIHGVQYFDQELPSNTTDYGEWIANMEDSIQNWQNNSISEGDTPAWATSAAHHCRLLLHRPCSRNIVPSEASLQVASSMAITTIDGYWKLVQMGNSVFAFQYVFQGFQAGMVLLYALRNHAQSIRALSLEEEAYQTLERLADLLSALSIRWPVASDTSQFIRELKGTILRSPGLEDESIQAAYDVNLLAELDFLVTQRRIHSVYHQNIQIPTSMHLSPAASLPWLQEQQSPSFSDDLWNDFINTGFIFNFDDAFMSDPFNPPELNPPIQPPELYHNSGEDESLIDQGRKQVPDLKTLLDSIPACGLCRGQHIKCDRQFPSCGACTRSQRECTYYDAVLQKDVSRRYIHTLYEKLGAIPPVIPTNHPQRLIPPPSRDFGLSCHLLVPSSNPLSAEAELGDSSQQHDSEILDNMFFGSTSSLVHLQQILSQAHGIPPAQSGGLSGTTTPHLTFQEPEAMELQKPSPPVVVALFRAFTNSVNAFYPTMKDSQLEDMLHKSQHDLISTEGSYDNGLFYFVLAIGSHFVGYRGSGTAVPSLRYFQEAMNSVNRSRRSWLHVDQLFLLQRSLLISVYLLLRPDAGDVWRNLGFAIRLYFDISHRPSANDNMDEELLYMLSRTLYCLECRVSVAFGRPSLLVIGDSLREDMTVRISRSIQEFVSIFFYRISLVKMQILDILLLHPDKQDHNRRDKRDLYSKQLQSWSEDWESALPVIATSQGEHSSIPILTAWAQLHYHHASLLLRDYSPALVTPADYLLHCDQIVQACAKLARHERRCVLGNPTATILLPTDWVMTHLLFGIGLRMLTSRGSGRSIPDQESKDVLTRCFTGLALLEGDAIRIATGFSEVLEDLGQLLDPKQSTTDEAGIATLIR